MGNAGRQPPGAGMEVYVLELARREEAGEVLAPLAVGPYTMFTLVSAVQLAYRHPNLSPELREVLRGIGDKIIHSLFGGTLGESFLEKGWDRSHDI